MNVTGSEGENPGRQWNITIVAVLDMAIEFSSKGSSDSSQATKIEQRKKNQDCAYNYTLHAARCGRTLMHPYPKPSIDPLPSRQQEAWLHSFLVHLSMICSSCSTAL